MTRFLCQILVYGRSFKPTLFQIRVDEVASRQRPRNVQPRQPGTSCVIPLAHAAGYCLLRHLNRAF